MKSRRIWAAIAVFVLFAAALVIWHDRLGADFNPPDSSRVGPNLVASLIQAAVVFIIAVLVYPPWRRAVARFADGKLSAVHEKLDTHLRELREHRTKSREHDEWMARVHADIHKAVVGKEPPQHPHFDVGKSDDDPLTPPVDLT